MSLQDISLPVDIPWKLIATSNDMLANHKKRFPHAMWKSSLAVFAYDPDPNTDLPDEIKDQNRELSFLKVVCSITSYVPPCQDCPLPYPEPIPGAEDYGDYDQLREEWRRKCKLIEEAENKVYPCSGALIQVSIYPKDEKDETADPEKLAYFASFEPKKRELIEAVTESGESMTQSKSGLSVRKGTTSTDSVDDYDLLTGVNVGGGFAGASAQVGVSGQWGTIKKSGSEHVDITNADSSRELREGSSHTTSLSQLYHLLNSYHLGTNRAIFFIQPRPHTVQQKDRFTFIDGPQEIEGIQEFFLVLSRPAGISLENYCVDALLYTAHLDDSISNIIQEPKTAETQWIDFSTLAPKIPDDGHSIFNIVEDFNDLKEFVEDRIREMEDLATSSWNDPSSTTNPQEKKILPRIGGGYITPMFINNPTILTLAQESQLEAERLSEIQSPSRNSMWKIDRTRGLGGYDLWEDPNNQSGIPHGQKKSKFPPEASIDIISLNSPDNPNYLHDYALRVRTEVWPSTESLMMYHGRIKAYFIRENSVLVNRNVPMFITVRGTSTCNTSPLFNFSTNKALKFDSDIAGDNQIVPYNVSPWKVLAPIVKNANFESIQDPEDKDHQLIISTPVGNTLPTGLDPEIIGAAHAKMANMVGREVMNVMNKSLSCLAEDTDGLLTYPFRYSDFFWNKVAPKLLNSELQRLSSTILDEPHLAREIITHDRVLDLQLHLPSIAQVQNSVNHILSKSKKPVKKQSKNNNEKITRIKKNTVEAQFASILKEKRSKMVENKKFPMLTLTNDQIPNAIRKSLNKGGINSGLDLIGLSAKSLSTRLKMKEQDIRKIRLQILGINIQENKSKTKDNT